MISLKGIIFESFSCSVHRQRPPDESESLESSEEDEAHGIVVATSKRQNRKF